MQWLSWLGLLYLAVWAGLILAGLPGLVRLRRLRPSDGAAPADATPTAATPAADTLADGSPWPSVSIVVAARDEADHVGAMLASLRALDYPRLEIIAVNDRSRDDTGARLRAAAAGDARVTVLDVAALPAGWIGKNHALYRGAARARGEWLLFTDADVIFHPAALRAALAYAHAESCDHLALTPRVDVGSFLLRGLVLLFQLNLVLIFRPQNARRPRSPASIGVGAFNLLSRRAYQAIGTHRTVRLRPDDDLKLGARVKQLGLRQHLALGDELLSLTWYPSVGAMMRGLEKNMLAPLEYRFGRMIGGIAALAILYLIPFAAPFASGWGASIYAALLVLSGGYFCLLDRFSPRALACFVAFPVVVPLFLYAMARATWLTWRRGGIVWRDTFYSLAELRAERARDGGAADGDGDVASDGDPASQASRTRSTITL